MYEVELKVSADHDRVRERLDELDATPVRAVVQEDTYYDAPDRSFAETDEALRVRRESPGSFSDAGPAEPFPGEDREAEEAVRVTYKGPKVDAESKTREEHETGVEDGETMDRILQSLGYSPAATVRKERAMYELSGFEVTLDRVDGVGEFVEVDADAREAEVAATRDRARDLLERLDLDPDAGIRTSYLGLVLADDS